MCIDGAFVKYPIENDLAGLPTELRNRCLLDFLFNEHAGLGPNPANLDEWFLGNFGQGLTDHYFRPYNEKTWNVPLAELSMAWAERIPQPPTEDVVKGALGISTEGYLHQLHYHYPSTGGYEALTTAWAGLLPPERASPVVPVREIVPTRGSGSGRRRAGSTTTEWCARLRCPRCCPWCPRARPRPCEMPWRRCNSTR